MTDAWIIDACRTIGTIVDRLERCGANDGPVTMCAGGGMAPAIIVERME